MANQLIFSESDPARCAAKIRESLTALADDLRAGVEKVSDPKAQALFETTAEVLQGLSRAHEHFEKRSETAWKRAS